jgi:site-specific recombinase XerD
MHKFEDYLKRENLAKNTVESYQSSVDLFFSRYEAINKDNLLSFKAFLVDSYKGENDQSKDSRNKQISGIHQKGKPKTEIHQAAAKELS